MPILLRAGSNVNAQRSNDGFSALHVAAMVGRLEVANLLLQVVIIMIDVFQAPLFVMIDVADDGSIKSGDLYSWRSFIRLVQKPLWKGDDDTG